MRFLFNLVFVSPVAATDYALSATRGGDTPVLARDGTYNYVPSVIFDGRWRVWWCAGLAGDFIWYSESASLDAGWSTPRHVFGPNTARPGSFDDQHTCDPSVLRVGGALYLFYGGLTKKGEIPDEDMRTALGVAISKDDGETWVRMNGGKPIVEPARVRDFNHYGAGQPSVVFLYGLFYMVYTDTTGAASPGHGGCSYAMRSKAATFQISEGTEVLSDKGWEPLTSNLTARTQKHLICCVSTDWVFSDVLDAFVLGCDGYTKEATRLKMFSKDTLAEVGTIDVPGHWTEGPGLAGRPDQHALFSAEEPAKVPVDIMRSIGPGGPNTWSLAHNGADVAETTAISEEALMARSVAALEGYLLSAPGSPLTFIVDGQRLQFSSAAPAQRLSRNSLKVKASLFKAVPYGGSMHRGARVIGASGKPAAFILDDKKWRVDCLEIITDNGSQIESVSVEVYNSFVSGPTLRCLHDSASTAIV